MTTLEHALLGADLTLATGLTKKFGWQLAAVAGVCAVLPDWDGLTILWSVPLFDAAHRCWGHGLLPAIVAATIFALLDYRFDFMARLARFFVRLLKLDVSAEPLQQRREFTLCGAVVWMVFGAIASLSHLLADMVVSGTATLADWDVKLLWPFSDRGFVYPLVPWGDVGNMMILLLGLFAMLRWKNRVQTVAVLTLLAVIGYTVIRGMI